MAMRTVGLITALLTACAPEGPAVAGEEPPRRFEFRETHMGSEFKILLYSADEALARRASRAAFDRIARLDRAFSDYDPESELMRLCDRAGGPPVRVSDDLLDILVRSADFHERSGGLFDPTIAPVGRLWRRARRDRKMPDPDRLAAARTLVGWDGVVLDREAGTVRLARPGMKLDLGGIAKGYAGDEARKVLAGLGLTRCLIAGAGDVVAGDPPPDSAGWSVAIAGVGDPQVPPRHVLSLANRAVSTSGDAERFVEIDGRRYSHIVDPRSGLGHVDRASATVVAGDGATADALATIVYLMGPERGPALIDATPGTAALFVRKGADGEDETFASARFGELPRSSGAGPDPGESRGP